jgi:hypothetical protein
LAGALIAAAVARELRLVYDVDWYRNPRAFSDLRSRVSTPPETTVTAEVLARAGDAMMALLTELL